MNDSLAQLVEQLTLNQWVEGSNPSGVTKGGRNFTLFLCIIVRISNRWRFRPQSYSYVNMLNNGSR